MKMVKLGDLMVTRSQMLNPANHTSEEFELHSIPAFDRGEPEIALGRIIGSSKQIVQPQDVLLSRIVPHIRRAAVVPLASGRKQLASSEWIVFRHESFDPKYLVYFLTSDLFHKQFLNTVAGVGGSLLRARPQYVRSILAPLPPLDEQRRIAAILDKADAIRQKRHQAIAHLETLTQSIFHRFANEGSQEVNLKELGIGFTSGKSVVGTKGDIHPTNRILKVDSISSGTFDASATKQMPASYSPPAHHLISKGDLLFGRASGSLDRLGATAVVDQEVDSIYLPDKVWKVSLSEDSLVSSEYALGIFRSAPFKAFIRHNASGAAGVRNISQSKVLEFQPKFVNQETQENYSIRAKAVRKLTESMCLQLSDVTKLFESLQARAFRGEL